VQSSKKKRAPNKKRPAATDSTTVVADAVGASVPMATSSVVAAHAATDVPPSSVQTSSALSSVAPSAVGGVAEASVFASSVALKDISVDDVSIILANLRFPALVHTFQSNGVSGRAIARMSSFQEIQDMGNNKISKFVAQTFFEDFALEWKKSGLVPKELLQPSSATSKTAENPISHEMVVDDPVSTILNTTEAASSMDVAEESAEFGKEDNSNNISSAQTNFANKFEASVDKLIFLSI